MALVIKDNKFHCKGKTCKKGILHISAALKHIINSEECKKEYTADQLNGIKHSSGKRTEQKDLKRRRENYDPLERSKKHKKSYDSAKRKEKYQKEKNNRELPVIEVEPKKKGKDENSLECNEILMEHKFVVIVESITLKNEKPTECTIRHSYPLFGNGEFISSTFSLEFGSKGDEENGLDLWEHIVKPQDFKEADVTRFLTDNLFEIQLFTRENYLGSAKIQLSRIYDPTSQRISQKSFKEKLEIKSKNDISIGTMEFFFVLVTEKCIRCKGRTCKKEILKMSTALKHITQSKNCKKEYTTDDILALRSQSKKRKVKNEIKRQRDKYDPKKRAEKLEIKKEKDAEILRKAELKHKEERLKRLPLEKEESEKKARSKNKGFAEHTKEILQRGVEQIKEIGLSKKLEKKIAIMNDTIDKTFNQFEKEIDVIAKNAKDKGWDYDELYYTLMPNRLKKKPRLYHDWHDLGLELDLALKNIAAKLKKTYCWTQGCFCTKCKSAKNMSDKEAKNFERSEWIRLGLMKDQE